MPLGPSPGFFASAPVYRGSHPRPLGPGFGANVEERCPFDFVGGRTPAEVNSAIEVAVEQRLAEDVPRLVEAEVEERLARIVPPIVEREVQQRVAQELERRLDSLFRHVSSQAVEVQFTAPGGTRLVRRLAFVARGLREGYNEGYAPVRLQLGPRRSLTLPVVSAGYPIELADMMQQ